MLKKPRLYAFPLFCRIILLTPILLPTFTFFLPSLALHHSYSLFQSSVFLFFSDDYGVFLVTDSGSINALDVIVSVRFNLLLANITILLHFFFLFRIVFNSFFTVSYDYAVIENATLKLALAIPTGAPITYSGKRNDRYCTDCSW